MNWAVVISFLSSLAPMLFRKKTPLEHAIDQHVKRIRFLKKEFRRKDSKGGRSYTKEEMAKINESYNEMMDYIEKESEEKR